MLGAKLPSLAQWVTIGHNNNIIHNSTSIPATKLWQFDTQPPIRHATSTTASSIPLASLVALLPLCMLLHF